MGTLIRKYRKVEGQKVPPPGAAALKRRQQSRFVGKLSRFIPSTLPFAIDAGQFQP
jgi:hypothetical protein